MGGFGWKSRCPFSPPLPPLFPPTFVVSTPALALRESDQRPPSAVRLRCTVYGACTVTVRVYGAREGLVNGPKTPGTPKAKRQHRGSMIDWRGPRRGDVESSVVVVVVEVVVVVMVAVMVQYYTVLSGRAKEGERGLKVPQDCTAARITGRARAPGMPRPSADAASRTVYQTRFPALGLAAMARTALGWKRSRQKPQFRAGPGYVGTYCPVRTIRNSTYSRPVLSYGGTLQYVA